MNTARLTSNRIPSKNPSLSLLSPISNDRLRRSLIPSRWAWRLPRTLRSPLTRQRPPIMFVYHPVLAMSRWTRLSRNSVRSSVLSHVVVECQVECQLVVQVACLPPLVVVVMEAQRLPLLRLLLPKNVLRQMLKSPNRNVRLPKRLRELLRLPMTASMPRRRELMMRASR